ncbi:MAG: hypothetical protein GVY31_02185 [Alphaproteobacteria bacterium]|jgi:hypothetical protein|nr:hypothetical protein [Alphaproteobacteria bacterium]
MTDEKVACRTPTRGRGGVTNIPKWKFDLIRGHILALVDAAGPDGLLWKGLSDEVAARLNADEKARLGNVGWHTVTVKLELECRGELKRVPKASPQRILRA